MSSYYDSVAIKGLQQKEQTLSLTSKLYDAGVWFSNCSNMYKGRSYTIDLNKTDEVPSLNKSEVGSNENKTHTYKQKLSASIGRCMKEIAGRCNREIKAKHLLTQELNKEVPDANLINKCRAIILGDSGQPVLKRTTGEGNDIADIMCAERCADCCIGCCSCYSIMMGKY